MGVLKVIFFEFFAFTTWSILQKRIFIWSYSRILSALSRKVLNWGQSAYFGNDLV